jgi:hypothetical protein
MPAYLEVWTPAGIQPTLLDDTRVAVGSGPGNDLVLDFDDTVSRLHALFEHFGGEWVVRDVGSRNGTSLNGERVTGERVLRSGDELRIGGVRVVYRADVTRRSSVTREAEPPPDLTRRERDVLLALCSPLLSAGLLEEPAAVHDIATELVITESAVKKHLGRLYDKFGLYDRRRSRSHLAHAAIRVGVVSTSELRTGNQR